MMQERSLEERHIEEMEGDSAERKRAPIDILAEAFGGNTRKERRAFKSKFKNLVRKEARKKKRRQ